MNSRQKEKLLKLAEALKSIPKNLFDLDVIIRINLGKDYSVYDAYGGYIRYDYDSCEEDRQKEVKKLTKLEPKCKATACALGLCPVVFPRTVKWDENLSEVVFADDSTVGSWDTAKQLFGLDIQQVEYLFMPDSYHESKRGPKSVADRIEAFVARDGKLSKQFLENHDFILGD